MAVVMRVVDLVRTLRGQAGIKVRQPLARMWIALPGRRAGGARDAPGAGRRRGERQVDRADRRRVGAGRSAGQAAAAEDRQEARVGHPGRHGRRAREPFRDPGRRLRPDGRRDARCRRGRDPRHTAARNGGRPRRGPGRRHRHRADARAAGRRRCPRAAARHPGCPQGGRRRARRRGQGSRSTRRPPRAQPWSRTSTRSRPRRAARSSSAWSRRPSTRSPWSWTPVRSRLAWRGGPSHLRLIGTSTEAT